MNSGLSPGDPTLVAAFGSALLHQGAVALLMLVLVWLLWATARTWRSGMAPGATADGPSADTGRNWTPGLLDAGLADTPGAIAVGPSGRALALLRDGTIETAPTAGSAAAGRWAPLTTRKALAASAPGRSCGLEGVTAVSFGPNQYPMAAGSCARPGAAGVFTDAGGTWRSAGLTLPGPVPNGRVRVLALTAIAGGNAALLAVSRPGGNSLRAAWWDGTRWTVSAAVTADGVRALGFGPGGSYDALAVAGSRLTVWRLAHGAWAKVQQVIVPVQYGSSG